MTIFCYETDQLPAILQPVTNSKRIVTCTIITWWFDIISEAFSRALLTVSDFFGKNGPKTTPFREWILYFRFRFDNFFLKIATDVVDYSLEKLRFSPIFQFFRWSGSPHEFGSLILSNHYVFMKLIWNWNVSNFVQILQFMGNNSTRTLDMFSWNWYEIEMVQILFNSFNLWSWY